MFRAPIRGALLVLAASAGCLSASTRRETRATTSAVVRHTDESRAEYRIVDLMPSFWRYRSRVASMDDSTRVYRFRAEVVAPDSAMYALIPAPISDERIRRWLRDIESREPAMRRLSDRFPSAIAESWPSFARTFPDVRHDVSLCVMPSLGTFDGMSRTRGDSVLLLFGIDQIARTSGTGANLTPQIQHELFHLYQAQVNPTLLGTRALYVRLWQEGLAVHVTEVLNPGATAGEIYLSDSLPRLAQPVVPRVAEELRAKLESTAPEAERDYFSPGAAPPGMIPKTGYYVGALVAARLGRHRSLAELARLNGVLLRTAIDSTLADLARGAAP